jgi:ubiquinone/menaquinone biosynthesis C-methylase UbiE
MGMSTATGGSAARRLDCSLPIYTRTQNATSPTSLPDLPFADDSFDLVLSSHLLFTYSDRLDRAFHRAALLELARVSRGQVRAFPLVSQIGRPETELVEQVMADLAAADVRASIRAVDYYFEPGAGSMLVLDP